MTDANTHDANTHPGSCLCGAVTFVATGPLRDVIGCHCTQCRKTSGHYWAATSVPLDQFVVTGDAGLKWFRASPMAERGFCADCGSSLFWKPEGGDRMAIAAGAFDGDPPFRLSHHIFTDDAGDYYTPHGAPARATADPARLACSCQCGAVAFDLPGPAGAVTACHCTQCRKLSGHYSASFDADERTVVWHARSGLAEYETCGKGRRGFCKACGSSLYFRAADGAFSVEAGAVSGATGGRLTDHIFTAFKGAYYTIDDGLPQS